MNTTSTKGQSEIAYLPKSDVNCDMLTSDRGVIDDVIVKIMLGFDIIGYEPYDSVVKFTLPSNCKTSNMATR